MKAKRAWLIVLLVAGGLMILGWSQPWFALVTNDNQRITVPGSAAVPGLLAIGLASLALAVALTIAPKVLRYVLGGLGAALALAALGVQGWALLDVVGASISTVTNQTGLAGRETVEALLQSTEIAIWPVVGVTGALGALFGSIGVLLSASAWPASASRYDRTPTERDAWGALTEGDDPTR